MCSQSYSSYLLLSKKSPQAEWFLKQQPFYWLLINMYVGWTVLPRAPLGLPHYVQTGAGSPKMVSLSCLLVGWAGHLHSLPCSPSSRKALVSDVVVAAFQALCSNAQALTTNLVSFASFIRQSRSCDHIQYQCSRKRASISFHKLN